VNAWLKISMAVIAALTLLGLVALWPRGDAPDLGTQPRKYVDATISSVSEGVCPGIEVPGDQPCKIYGVDLSSGPDKGDTATFSVQPTQFDVPPLSTGDKVVLSFVSTAPAGFQYAFVDFQRATPMLLLAIAFAVVVLLFGRFQGVRALLGLGLSMLVLVVFVVPALLRDSPAVLVALVGTVTVAYLAIYLAHGIGMNSTIALAGTLVSLAVTCGLAIAMASLTQLSGLASEESQTLRVTADALDLRGLLVAGIVVGALGVLDDVTVSQVSIVAALRRANPSLGARQLYAEATKVGRDHVASAVNTLALAYAGASLPLLLFFAQGDQPVGRLVTGELVAVEIVRMLVGSIGLVLSVPVTTRLAAVVLSRTDEDDLDDDDGHGHFHGGFDDLHDDRDLDPFTGHVPGRPRVQAPVGPGGPVGAGRPPVPADGRTSRPPRRPITEEYDWRDPDATAIPPGPDEPWF
jgi:uncharacterized membrane protein